MGPRADSRATMRSRVSSPSAAKIGAVLFGLSRLADILFDRFHLCGPTVVVPAIRFQAASQRNPIEPRFYNCEQRPFRGVGELKHDQSGGLRGVVELRVNRVGVPAPREELFGFHALDGDLERNVLVAGVRDLSAEASPWRERSFERHAKPSAELLCIRQRAPDSGPGSAQDKPFFDAVGGIYVQPPGCRLAGLIWKCNRIVADY